MYVCMHMCMHIYDLCVYLCTCIFYLGDVCACLCRLPAIFLRACLNECVYQVCIPYHACTYACTDLPPEVYMLNYDMHVCTRASPYLLYQVGVLEPHLLHLLACACGSAQEVSDHAEHSALLSELVVGIKRLPPLRVHQEDKPRARASAYLYVCMYVRMCECMYACMCTHTHTHRRRGSVRKATTEVPLQGNHMHHQ